MLYLVGGILIGAILSPVRTILERWILSKLARFNEGTSERNSRLKMQASERGFTGWLVTYRTTSDHLESVRVSTDNLLFHGDEIIILEDKRMIIIDRRASLVTVLAVK